MEEKKSYYAIIPADVRYCKGLTANAKLLYGEITALCNEKGYCWASNKYFAELYGVSNTSISLWIKALRDSGFIDYEVLANYKRKVYLKGVLRKVKGGIKKSERGVLRKVKKNNTTNNKKNNTTNIAKTSFADKNIPLIIEKFKELTPSLSYGNKTQRKACDEMIKQFGIDEVFRMVEMVLSVQGKKYAPRATTPHAMWTKIGDFKAYFKENNNQITKIDV